MGESASYILKTLGKSEAVDLLQILKKSDGGVGFNQIKNKLKTDPKTVTRRIDELVDLGIIKKRDNSNYDITPLGHRVLELALEIETEVNDFESNNLAQ